MRRSAAASAPRSSSISGGEGGSSTGVGGLVRTVGAADAAGVTGVALMTLLAAGSGGISCVPLRSAITGSAARSVGIGSGWRVTDCISALAGATAMCVAFTLQLSVLAVASPMVASYAATSSTGNSAVASLSTSVLDAAVFTGALQDFPRNRSSGADSSPRPAGHG